MGVPQNKKCLEFLFRKSQKISEHPIQPIFYGLSSKNLVVRSDQPTPLMVKQNIFFIFWSCGGWGITGLV